MQAVPILDSKAFGLTVNRLCYQLIEDHDDLRNTVLLGMQPRGVLLARRIRRELGRILAHDEFLYGELDITFHRDDFRQRTLAPSTTQLDLSLEERKVVLIDDVLYTGRSIRAGLDALLSFGRPSAVQLLVLVDRRFERELPIAPDYVGRWVDSIAGQRVSVEWKESEGRDQVLLLTSGAADERETSATDAGHKPTPTRK
ncbi:MAG: bifunctional pyr operon transcriptional regulator/uracil phosphoribosyltransferase PyrR [Flavobacteriales bacterium]|nr:bifunctional pyr operon transcriptional regulator/uracil phosphoribosyltransferase PyrR [Flavobacteriales bacterium]